jgi:hypothetical protein
VVADAVQKLIHVERLIHVQQLLPNHAVARETFSTTPFQPTPILSRLLLPIAVATAKN